MHSCETCLHGSLVLWILLSVIPVQSGIMLIGPIALVAPVAIVLFTRSPADKSLEFEGVCTSDAVIDFWRRVMGKVILFFLFWQLLWQSNCDWFRLGLHCMVVKDVLVHFILEYGFVALVAPTELL